MEGAAWAYVKSDSRKVIPTAELFSTCLSVTDLIIDSETDEEEAAGVYGDDLFFLLGRHLCEHIYSTFQAAAEVDHWRPPRCRDLDTVDVLNEIVQLKVVQVYFSVTLKPSERQNFHEDKHYSFVTYMKDFRERIAAVLLSLCRVDSVAVEAHSVHVVEKHNAALRQVDVKVRLLQQLRHHVPDRLAHVAAQEPL